MTISLAASAAVLAFWRLPAGAEAASRTALALLLLGAVSSATLAAAAALPEVRRPALQAVRRLTGRP